MHVSKLILLIVLSWVKPGNLSGLLYFLHLSRSVSSRCPEGGSRKGTCTNWKSHGTPVRDSK